MKARLQHKSKQKKVLKILIFSLLFVGLGMLLPRVLSSISATIMYPVHVTNNWFEESTSLIPTLVREKQLLQNEIESLKNELNVSRGTDLTKQRLQEENNRLRLLLGAPNETRVVASVIARPDELPYDLLQIDRGSQAGVEVGAPVFVGQDVVIGLVVHVAPKYSFVELFTTPGFKATVYISGPNVVATMEGFGGGVARVQVPQGIPLQTGNLIYLPSIEPGVFGHISHIESRPTQSEQYGFVTSDIAISSLFLVTVGKQSQITHSASEINEAILEKMNTELLVNKLNLISTTTEETATSSE